MTSSLFDLTGRVALVTGGASGLGQAAAHGLAAAGARVIIADLDEAGAVATAAAITAAGGPPSRGLRVDIADETSVTSLFSEVDAWAGRIDVLVNAAFVPPIRTYPENYPTDDWERVMRVDLTGYFLCSRAAGRRMIAAGGGSIVNFSSIAATSALGRGNFSYSIAKAGVNQMTKELAIEWARHGIRVNAIQPCQFLTPALQRFIDDPEFDSDAMIGRFLGGIPLGHLGDPRDMAGPVVFLASPAAAMVTGVILPVDGGNLAMDAGASLRW